MSDAARPTDYERSDASPWLIVALAAGLTGTVIGIMIGLTLLFPQSLADRPKGPITALPPAPRLQVSPKGDLIRYENAETRRLTSYGWVNRAQGRVHVPVEQAMRAVAAGNWQDGMQ